MAHVPSASHAPGHGAPWRNAAPADPNVDSRADTTAPPPPKNDDDASSSSSAEEELVSSAPRAVVLPPATFTAAIRTPSTILSLCAAAGTYFHAYVHALTTPPSLHARRNGQSRVIETALSLAPSPHASSRIAGVGTPADTITTSLSRGEEEEDPAAASPAVSSSTLAPSSASASGAYSLRVDASSKFKSPPSRVRARKPSTSSNHSSVVYRANGTATWYAPHDPRLWPAGAGYRMTPARCFAPS